MGNQWKSCEKGFGVSGIKVFKASFEPQFLKSTNFGMIYSLKFRLFDRKYTKNLAKSLTP